MTSAQYASLEKAIQRWADKEVESPDGLAIWFGPRTVEYAATAARHVFDAIEDSREAEREQS